MRLDTRTGFHGLLVLLLSAAFGCSSLTPSGSRATQNRDADGVVRIWTDPEDHELSEPDTTPEPQIFEENVLEPDTAGNEAAAAIPATVAEPVEDPVLPSSEELVASSLEYYESSKSFWEAGEFENALLSLDRAYELMDGIETQTDAAIEQEKEDLRYLISRRIVEIYASQRTAAGDFEGSVPLELNESVERWIKSFQNQERKAFLAGYQRSGLYRPMVVEKLRAAGLPEELSWLPMVESWFKVRALSRARALGMWQFISSTGYRYGLERSHWFDERMDPVKSTDAALAYLTDLHDLFGDWLTALAAYNCGESRVQRIIRSQSAGYLDRFWDIHPKLPRETRAYVPRLIATILIVNDPQKYGFNDLPEPFPPFDHTTIETTRSVRLSSLEKEMNLPSNSLVELNPELRQKATPDAPYALRVPNESAGIVLAAMEAVPKAAPAPAATTTHRVRRGESLSTVANRYGTSVRTLMRLNNIRNANRIWPGQTLIVNGTARASNRSGSSSSGGTTSYTVRRGDSLWTIARRFGTTVDRIKRANGLRSSRLRPGQKLKISGGGGSSSGGSTYTVRRGDTLGGIAQSRRVSVRALAAANNISVRNRIYPGQKLVIPR